MKITLPYPDKVLWPNGRTKNYRYRAMVYNKAKGIAYWSALEVRDRLIVNAGELAIRLTVYPKARGPAPDKDNCIAAMKAYQDGIAQAIGIDDRHFAAPVVVFSPRRLGKFVIELGQEVLSAAPEVFPYPAD